MLDLNNSHQISNITPLAEALCDNSTLQLLNLCGNNQITDISDLAEALRHNSTLQRLYLRGNQISESDKGAFMTEFGSRFSNQWPALF